jgi:hypothetical protein
MAIRFRLPSRVVDISLPQVDIHQFDLITITVDCEGTVHIDIVKYSLANFSSMLSYRKSPKILESYLMCPSMISHSVSSDLSA